jgi:hypothetical protein
MTVKHIKDHHYLGNIQNPDSEQFSFGGNFFICHEINKE